MLFHGSGDGVHIIYLTDGKLFNLRKFSAKTKVKQDVVIDFLFADDSALNTTDKTEMQHCLDEVSGACDDYGLTISTIKTETMFQPAIGVDNISLEFTVNG